ncbi:MAG TPA: DUF302 domain-containing protein [Planctomycetes bacterium]|nr:DUF302 domain-containing protein [Planctomycetota bacterium]
MIHKSCRQGPLQEPHRTRMEITMLIQYQSDRNLDEIIMSAPSLAQERKWGVLGEHDLKAKLQEKGHPIDREVRVLEVCSPAFAQKALETQVEISVFMPCRISIWEENGKRVLATVKPTVLLQMAPNESLSALAVQAEQELSDLMKAMAG